MEGMETLPRLNQKMILVSSLNDIDEEREFWFSKGALERINAIELQRKMVYGIDRTTPRLQRLFETSELLQN